MIIIATVVAVAATCEISAEEAAAFPWKTRATKIHFKALRNDCGDEILSWVICIFMNQLLPIF